MIFDINGNVISTESESDNNEISYFQSPQKLYWRRGIFNTSTGSLSSLSPDIKLNLRIIRNLA